MSNNGNHEFDFDTLLSRKAKVVKYEGKNYMLRDASEKATIEYEASRWKMERHGDTIRQSPSDKLFESSSVLVANCLFDHEGQPVSVEQLRQWPHQAIEMMYEWVVDNTPGLRRKDTREDLLEEMGKLQKRLKSLDEVPLEEMAKNSPAATARN